MPGIGILGATALAATLGDGKAWRSGREFAACLGLVPAHKGTGGKTRVGHLSKRGDPYLRTLLIHGARAVIQHAKHKPQWLEQMLARRAVQRGGGGSGQQDGSHGVGPGGSWSEYRQDWSHAPA
jgi:transposase